jgi:hypothetical protein
MLPEEDQPPLHLLARAFRAFRAFEVRQPKAHLGPSAAVDGDWICGTSRARTENETLLQRSEDARIGGVTRLRRRGP